ncbi:hypothetical protein BV25DRAFT_166277 [Artomyces pyxidatus]|uniref:Uncharacterized protein n=1 Tax=Artomyces pyxidatus TaxID=48021 RepID=A0ACB8SI46_9AGAM|nr:hypothetical protein BV25DRAFT_166277 [Artomyces pyxidatus]
MNQSLHSLLAAFETRPESTVVVYSHAEGLAGHSCLVLVSYSMARAQRYVPIDHTCAGCTSRDVATGWSFPCAIRGALVPGREAVRGPFGGLSQSIPRVANVRSPVNAPVSLEDRVGALVDGAVVTVPQLRVAQFERELPTGRGRVDWDVQAAHSGSGF